MEALSSSLRSHYGISQESKDVTSLTEYESRLKATEIRLLESLDEDLPADSMLSSLSLEVSGSIPISTSSSSKVDD